VSPDEGIIRISRKGQDVRLHGQIIDVSVGGCRVSFSGAVLPALQSDERLTECDLQVTSALAVSARGVIRHSAWDAANRTTLCGIEFTEMAIPDRRRLEHYVSQLASRSAPATRN
jgi:c-di-GMP-binding flagellar brake protein YcgR